MELPVELKQEFLRPLVNGWLGKLEAAEKARTPWLEVARECMDFYAKSARALWDPKSSKRIFKGQLNGKFRMTINKAFELVAIYGPGLLWDIPHRQVDPRPLLDLPMDMLGSPDDPQIQMMMQQIQMERMQQDHRDRALSSLMQGWLNYTAVESGLEGQSEMAVVDAMVKGRGCLWIEKYNPPNSRRVLTGSYRDSPENLLLDPDFDSLDECKWIARKRVKPVWEVERIFNLPPGTLKGKATLESQWSRGERRGESGSESKRAAGLTNDLLAYTEIFSKTGCGCRLTGMETMVKDRFEEVVGDYAYLAICASVPWPLNCPVEFLRGGASREEVRKRFEWPCPLWADDKWPVENLDFYVDPDSAWPIPPLGPVMGPLKFLNTFMGHLCNRIWSSSRDFIAVMESAMNDLKSKIEEGEDMCIIPLKEIHGDINKVVGFLQQPQTNLDVWRIIEAVSEWFDKGSGLSEFHYAMNPEGTQNRTAEESKNKRFAAGIRPEYMQKKVIEWQGRVAATEAFLARWYVTGDDVQRLLGQTGKVLWEQIVMSSDVEDVVRQMQYTVAASSIRRPNRDRDSQNMQSLMQSPFMGLIAEYAKMTGNFDPLNDLLQQYGEFMDMDLSKVRFEQPEVNPADAERQAAEQEQQQKMEMEQQKLQGQMQVKGMEMEAKRSELEMKTAMMQMEMQKKQRELELETEKSQAEMAMSQQKHEQEMVQDSQRFNLDMRQQVLAGQQKIMQSRVEGIGKIEQQRAVGKEKVAAAKKMAQAKPKPANGKSKAKK